MRRQRIDGTWEQLPRVNVITMALGICLFYGLFIGACVVLF